MLAIEATPQMILRGPNEHSVHLGEDEYIVDQAGRSADSFVPFTPSENVSMLILKALTLRGNREACNHWYPLKS